MTLESAGGLEPRQEIFHIDKSEGLSADDEPAVAYCVTAAEAKTAIAEALRDAAGRPLAVDIETAPMPSEVARLRELERRLAALKGEARAAKKAKAPADEIDRLNTEEKLVKARIKHAAKAGLDPARSKIRLLQCFGGGRHVVVVDLFRTGPAVLSLLDSVDVVIHNAGFDLGFLEEAGVGLGVVHCTAQAARLTLNEWSMSLEDAALAHLGIRLDKGEQTSDWAAERLTRQQLEYAAQDVITVWRLAQRIFSALARQTPAYEIQVAATPAVSRMQRRGILMDLEAHANLIRALEAELAEKREEYRQAYLDMGLPDLATAPKTPNQIRAALNAMLTSEEVAKWQRTKKSGALSTARADLRRAAHYPPILPLVRITKITKLLSAFGPTLTALVNPVTLRVHPNYRISGASSGRATCSYPNLQQFPSKKTSKEFRTVVIAPPGRKIIAGDFAQMELRAAGYISREFAMIDAFRNGVDLHALTAANMLRKPIEEVTEEERSHAKPINFGAIYGEGARGLVASAWKDYELVLTEDEARDWLIAFSRAYPTFARWRWRHYEQCKAAGCITIGRDADKGLGRVYPLSRVPFGQSAYTRACNLPVQGGCADASMLALAGIDEALFDAGLDAAPIAWVHDEILLEVVEDDAPRAKALLEKAMSDAFEQTFPGSRQMGLLNGLVEANIGDNWAAAKEKPKAAP